VQRWRHPIWGSHLTPNGRKIATLKIIVQGVKEGTFETFDPVGVAGMLHQLDGAAHSIVARAIEGRSAAEREKAISMLDQRIKLYGIVGILES